MVPNTADGLPQVTDGGRTYTIKVKRGIYFAADPAFKGRKRELTAEDYVYSIKRIFDPKIRSYDLYLFENSLEGLDAPLARARKTGNFNYDEKIEGLQAADRYTLRIRFRRPEYAFQWWLATRNLAAVAREIVEAYGDESHRVMQHPVGTGPYRLKSWLRGQKIVLEANPDFRDARFPEPATGDSDDATIAKGLIGRRLPIAVLRHRCRRAPLARSRSPLWRSAGNGESRNDRIEAERERGVPLRLLEIPRHARKARAMRDDVGVVDRLGGRRAARVSGCLFQRGARQEISHRAKLPRHRLGIGRHRVNERQYLLDESHADRRVE